VTATQHSRAVFGYSYSREAEVPLGQRSVRGVAQDGKDGERRRVPQPSRCRASGGPERG